MADLQRELRRILRAQPDQDSAHDLAHADRVWTNAQSIANGENITPDDRLMAAAYLHDFISLPKDHPHRASASTLSAKAVIPVLGRLEFSAQEIREIGHAIKSHSFSVCIEPVSDIARILQDADRLEALGAIGLARCFAVSGALGRPLFDGEDAFAANRALDDTTFAVDHFAAKLLRLPETFQTQTGRKQAHQRADILRQYLRDLADELGQDAPSW